MWTLSQTLALALAIAKQEPNMTFHPAILICMDVFCPRQVVEYLIGAGADYTQVDRFGNR